MYLTASPVIAQLPSGYLTTEWNQISENLPHRHRHIMQNKGKVQKI
jgi:hypothetical protein